MSKFYWIGLGASFTCEIPATEPGETDRRALMRVPKVNADDCTGCGACVDTCPAVFQMGDDDIAQVVNPTGADEASIQEAIDSCPSSAIVWADK